jgi:hypothetical protein
MLEMDLNREPTVWREPAAANEDDVLRRAIEESLIEAT